jgi:RNA polymerase sigma-70 factor (ECF subfamily)
MSEPTGDEQDVRDMARLAGGHGAALNELMGRHAEKLFRYLLRSLQDENDASDLAQETFVRVYQNRSKFNPSQKFTTWLYAIASNLVRDRYRWRSRHPQVSLDAENELTEGSLGDNLRASLPSPDEQIETEERSAAVRAAIATLPEDLRQPLILAVYQELPQAEIAAILKCSVKAVETRIYRARQQLRSRLAEIMTVR